MADDPKRMLSNLRIVIVFLLFIITFALLQVSDSVKETPIKKGLNTFPQETGKWTLTNTRRLSNRVIKMIGVDDYIDYDYAAPDGSIVNLYVSYFNGKTGGYHSPRNCLPGSGWNVVNIKPLKLDINNSETGPFQVNLMIVQKGIDKQVVVYWYQNRGRIIASEYWGKIYLVLDSIFKRRKDGSFIRIMAPVYKDSIDETAGYLKEFAERVVVILREFIPGS